ncbi:hypothetical protein LEP1GSC194_0843 [Leptospira alstonii serovar Sichuan str. 79601]|uniref:Uncharacterized protein n=1 Tax=Leptospira alstonii serovar Sichuan str. 79601 TaxID=1218565 RepID=M6DAT6_9LEPT|nr:hypothetical protein LEP1GSC194_0843 [Leptospira alstonii serovar Sichuan str. 79601]
MKKYDHLYSNLPVESEIAVNRSTSRLFDIIKILYTDLTSIQGEE